MPRNKKRFFDVEDNDEFETEAFAHMNNKEVDPSSRVEQHSDTNEDQDEEDAEIAPDEDSDDEAPDDVGFHESRQSVLSQLRSALKQVDDEKRKKREKRKLVDDHFKEQKLKKKEELAKAKLPDDFLENIEDAIPKKVRKTVQESKKIPEKQQKKKGKKMKAEEQSEEEEITPEPKTEDYIAFTDEPSGVQVASMKFIEKQSKTAAQRAAEFRNDRLYGRHINRESNKNRLAVKEKRRFRTS